VPVLIAMSDNGPQMRSHSTKEFMAACAIMQRFGRPGTPTDQAWIESLFGHVKSDWPHLEKIRDPGELALELDRVRTEYNTVRLSRTARSATKHQRSTLLPAPTNDRLSHEVDQFSGSGHTPCPRQSNSVGRSSSDLAFSRCVSGADRRPVRRNFCATMRAL
jgi:hypothetical protein